LAYDLLRLLMGSVSDTESALLLTAELWTYVTTLAGLVSAGSLAWQRRTVYLDCSEQNTSIRPST